LLTISQTKFLCLFLQWCPVNFSDNFATLHLINKTCFELHKTLISGAAIRAEGQFMVFDFAKGPQCPCYNCLFPQTAEEPALNCQNSGVFGSVLGIIGSMQASETMGK
jgi:molybdopterin/thiamine biosynthesis adenylyltransferase